MKNALDNESYGPGNKHMKGKEVSKFLTQIFKDNMEIESWVSTKDHMKILMGDEEVNEKKADIRKRFSP